MLSLAASGLYTDENIKFAFDLTFTESVVKFVSFFPHFDDGKILHQEDELKAAAEPIDVGTHVP